MCDPATPSAVYTRYDALIRKVEAWIASQPLSLPTYESSQLRSRLIQRIVERSQNRICLLLSEHLRREADSSSFNGIINIDGLIINLSSGTVCLSLTLCVFEILLFAKKWLYYLFIFLPCLFKSSRETPVKATFLFEAGVNITNSFEKFVEFCQQGPVEPLRTAKRLFVQSSIPFSDSSGIEFATDPFVAYITRYLPITERLLVFAKLLISPLQLLVSASTSRIFLLISGDILLGGVISQLDRCNRIDAMIMTTSHYLSQPLWAIGAISRTFSLHMVWYSQNFIPKMYKGDLIRPNLPAARHMRVDVNWVWTIGFSHYLYKLGLNTISYVVGPIVWYLPSAPVSLPSQTIQIGIFDVTPVSDSSITEGPRYYYSFRLIKKFIEAIVSASQYFAEISGRSTILLLKHKRSHKKNWHSDEYLSFISQLEHSCPALQLVDVHTDIFELIDRCNLTVSVPFTSTAYISASRNRPSLYYDPTGELVSIHESGELIYFASSEDELRALICQLLGL